MFSRLFKWAYLNCRQAPVVTPLYLALLLVCASIPAGLAQPAYFDIPSQQLSRALIQFSHQARMAIVFADDVARGLKSPALVGELDTREGLDQLLADSGLEYEIIDRSIIAVYPGECNQEQTCAGPEELLVMKPVYIPGLEEVFVYGRQITGSRIRRSHFKGSAPVDIVSAPDIEFSGAQTIGEVLKFLPAVSGNSTSTSISNGGDGTATVTLRGLPSSNTLVLVNGQRVANDGLAGESVDLNAISPAAIERIEILKDGASAIYGSDAIAGVINIILKRDYPGFLAETYYGVTGDSDLHTRTQTLQYGTGFGRGSLFLVASHYQQGSINSRDRPVSSSADGRNLGGADLRSSATPNPRITLPSGEVLIQEDDAADYRIATDEDLFDYAPFTTAVVPSEYSSFYGSISYDFSTDLTATVDLSYIENEATAQLAPTPIFTAFEQLPLIVAADNPYNPFGVDIEDIRRRVLELPPREQFNKAVTRRINLNLQGSVNDWHWDLGYHWSKSDARETLSNLINASNLQLGLGGPSLCGNGCTPIDLFGPLGSINSNQLDYLSIDGKVSGFSKLRSVSFHASGSPWELTRGAVDLAFGFEHRRETSSKKPGPRLAGISTLGGTNLLRTSGQREVNEAYIESIVPVWRSRNGRHGFDLELAMRYSDYSDFGSATNPKLGYRMRVGESLMLRGTYAEGFRAPTLTELYEGDTEDQAFLDDPCALAENVEDLPGCSQLADPTRIQFLTINGGNPLLKPEESKSHGIGLVWTPNKLPGLTTSVDLFRISQENVVDTGAQFILDQNAASGRYSDRINRDANGNLETIIATNLNIGEREVRGIDMSVSYRLPRTRWGQFSAALDISHIDSYTIQADPSARREDLAGRFTEPAAEGDGAIPEWKGNLGLQWTRGRWRGNYDLHYVSSLEEEIPNSNDSRTIDSWLIHDLQLSYRLPIGDSLRFSIGVDNLTDEAAPFAASAFNDNIDARTHELRGRFWYAKLSQRL